MNYAYCLVVILLLSTTQVLNEDAIASAQASDLENVSSWVIAAAYSSDGEKLVTAGGTSKLYRPGEIVIWNTNGSRIGKLGEHPTVVWAVQISDDGKLVATGGYDGLIKLWDLPSRSLKGDLTKQSGWVRSLAFSPDCTRLASSSEDGTMTLWDVSKQSISRVIDAHAGPVISIAFSPDGKTLVSGGSDSQIKVWDAVTGEYLRKLRGHADAIWTMAYAPDGTKLATAGADRVVKFWNTADWSELGTLVGHADWVTSVAFSPDGRRLASTSLDGAIKLWDVSTKSEQIGLRPSKSSLWCVRFSTDGKRLFMGSHVGGRLEDTPAPKPLLSPSAAVDANSTATQLPKQISPTLQTAAAPEATSIEKALDQLSVIWTNAHRNKPLTLLPGDYWSDVTKKLLSINVRQCPKEFRDAWEVVIIESKNMCDLCAKDSNAVEQILTVAKVIRSKGLSVVDDAEEISTVNKAFSDAWVKLVLVARRYEVEVQ